VSADFEIVAEGLAGLDRALRNASPDLQRTMRKALKDAARPIATAEKATAMGLDSSGGSGSSASMARAAWYLRNRKTVTDRSVSSALRKVGGLRAAMANSIDVQYRASGDSQGVWIRARGSKMPPSQRSLLRASTRARGWRHPVFGGKTWVEQRMSPPDWWRRTGDRELPVARRAIEAEFHKWVDRLGAAART
jgi:hypothetical protein